MLHQVLSWMYERPMWLYWSILAFLLVVWAVLGYLLRRHRLWIRSNIVLSALVMAAILCVTLVLRSTGEQGIVLGLTALLAWAKFYPDVYIQMQLNAILFVPIGATLPFGIFAKIKHPVIWTVVTAALFSVGIELGQYLFAKGYSELTDVLLNVSGAVIGVAAYALTLVIAKYCAKKEDHESS